MLDVDNVINCYTLLVLFLSLHCEFQKALSQYQKQKTNCVTDRLQMNKQDLTASRDVGSIYFNSQQCSKLKFRRASILLKSETTICRQKNGKM